MLVPDTASTMSLRAAHPTKYALMVASAQSPEVSTGKPFYFEDSQVVLQVSHKYKEMVNRGKVDSVIL